jgi:tetratricopeptide (TPR) repeat protein
MAAADSAQIATNQNLWMLNEIGVVLSNIELHAEAEEILRGALSGSVPAIETDDEAFSSEFSHSRADVERERARSFYQLGYLTGKRGEFRQAVGYSHQAIARDSTLSQAYVNLISGHLALSQVDSARLVLSEAKRRFPNDRAVQRITSQTHLDEL